MKIFHILFFMALLASGLTACHKDEAINVMAGTWEGAWGFDQDVPSYYERWEFKNNGEFKAYGYSGNLYAKGAFNVSGTEFTAEYTAEGSGSDYRFKGVYDETQHTISGTWGLSPSYTNRGLFEMGKQ